MRPLPDMLVTMNDWEPVSRNMVIEANKRGIPTVGVVEGVQDFEDTHVEHIGKGRIRRPYRTVKYPFLIGEYDRKFLPTKRGRVVGMDVTEHFPSLDLHGITSLAIIRLIVNLMGEMIRSGS